MKKKITIILALCLLAVYSPAIVMRHDVSEDRYLKLAEEHDGIAVRLNVGMGTFISPNWIITAAHVASSSRVGEEVTVNGKAYKFKQKVIHPGFDMNRGISDDIALIELEESVPGIKPAHVYTGDEEMGKEVIFIGAGWAGTGDKGMAEGEINKDRQMRAAQNLVDGIRPDNFIRFTFDKPGSDKALPLEGISGPGDSGGPALWYDGDTPYILGVSSHQDGRGMGQPEGRYGVYEFYSRVSAYTDWINEVMGN